MDVMLSDYRHWLEYDFVALTPARVSFAHFGGTAVSARQTEFALGERDE
jgi:hypothetical protein